MQPPTITRNLAPGSTGQDVKALQEWLKQQGYFPKTEQTTDYYGPITQNAVAAWQKAFAVTNTDFGYFGPVSRSFVDNHKTMQTMIPKNTAMASTPPPPPAPPKGTITAPSVKTDSSSQSQIPETPLAPVTNLQKSTLLAVSDIATSMAQTGKPPMSFSEALSYAAKDPLIIAKYANMMKMDSNAFQSSLEQLRVSTSTQQEQYKQQFEQERKALAEKSAAAGQAYSGFRGQAEKDLAQSESGIVTSSRSQLQKSLNDLATSFESRYGTAATPSSTLPFLNPSLSSNVTLSGLSAPSTPSNESISGQSTGGVTGNFDSSKQADIRAKALDTYNLAQFPTV